MNVSVNQNIGHEINGNGRGPKDNKKICSSETVTSYFNFRFVFHIFKRWSFAHDEDDDGKVSENLKKLRELYPKVKKSDK